MHEIMRLGDITLSTVCYIFDVHVRALIRVLKIYLLAKNFSDKAICIIVVSGMVFSVHRALLER